MKQTKTGARENEQIVRWEAEPTRIRLQRYLAHCLLGVFVVNSIAALVIVFFVGFGKMILSESLIKTVLAGTVAQTASVLVIVTKSLFSSSAT
jgi:hypothetical protein